MIIDKIQAQIVEEIFDMFLNGIGYQRISEICQSKYKVYKDKFSYYGIRYILSNEKYIGDSVYQKHLQQIIFHIERFKTMDN